jgi:hypothetical protein
MLLISAWIKARQWPLTTKCCKGAALLPLYLLARTLEACPKEYEGIRSPAAYNSPLRVVKRGSIERGSGGVRHWLRSLLPITGIHCCLSNAFFMLISAFSCAERVLPTTTLLKSEPFKPVKPSCLEAFKVMR